MTGKKKFSTISEKCQTVTAIHRRKVATTNLSSQTMQISNSDKNICLKITKSHVVNLIL